MTDRTQTTGEPRPWMESDVDRLARELHGLGESQTTAFPAKRVRMVRPGAIGITISGTEYVMRVSEANDLIGQINRAKHDGMSGAKAVTDTTKQAAVLAAALKLIDALEFYADPESYFALLVVGDPPCGDFMRDVSEMTEDDSRYWDDYRPGSGYYGKMARDALAAWRVSGTEDAD